MSDRQQPDKPGAAALNALSDRRELIRPRGPRGRLAPMSMPCHPMDDPARRPPWAALAALVSAITLMLSPAGAGNRPVSIALRTRVRRALREAEGRLRRLLLPDAEALLPTLAPLRPRAPVPGQLQHPRPASPARPRPNPFRFGLIEPADRPVRSPAGRQPCRPDCITDPYGLGRVPATREVDRLCRLIVTVETPGPAIRRLAHILRRRAARGRPRLPWRAGWRPRTDLNLTPPPLLPPDEVIYGPDGPPGHWPGDRPAALP